MPETIPLERKNAMKLLPTSVTRGKIEMGGSGNSVPFSFPHKRALICLIVFGLAALPAAAQDHTEIVNKTNESIYYAKAVWVRGQNPGGPGAGVAVEPINYYDIYGWYEVKAGETASVDWGPYLR